MIPPAMGLGTWGRTGPGGLDAILRAVEIGYRHFDTAQSYGTEANVGEAICRSGLPRDAFFVTTKVADTNLTSTAFLPSVRRSLDELKVNTIDLTLIHWPSHENRVPFEEYVDALAEARSLGMTSHVGVSNFPTSFVERAVERLGAGVLATNQVELHPFLQNRRLRTVCRRHVITVTAYMPLAGGLVERDETLRQIGQRHGVPASTAALAWLLQRGMAVIPASSRTEHLATNFRATSVTLSADELADIDRLDRGQRLINPAKSPEWDVDGVLESRWPA